MKAVVPVVKKNVTLFDYLQSLYVNPCNLLINYSHRQDAVAEDSTSVVDHTFVGCLKERMQRITSHILDNIVVMPSKYPSSHIWTVL